MVNSCKESCVQAKADNGETTTANDVGLSDLTVGHYSESFREGNKDLHDQCINLM